MNKRRRYKAKSRRYLQSQRMWNRFKAGLRFRRDAFAFVTAPFGDDGLRDLVCRMDVLYGTGTVRKPLA